MRKLLSSLAFTAVLLALGTAAFAAMPTSDAPAVADASPALNAGAAPAAPSAATNYTAISLPLEVDSVATADDVADYIDGGAAGGVIQVAYWSPGVGFIIRNVGSPFGTPDFNVSTGQFLLVGADSAAPTNMTWVGDVPAQGSVSFPLVASDYNAISVPLDQTSLATADDLGADMSADQVAYWDPAVGFIIRNVGSPFGVPNFDIDTGYPYLVRTTGSSPSTWPTP